MIYIIFVQPERCYNTGLEILTTSKSEESTQILTKGWNFEGSSDSCDDTTFDEILTWQI